MKTSPVIQFDLIQGCRVRCCCFPCPMVVNDHWTHCLFSLRTFVASITSPGAFLFPPFLKSPQNILAVFLFCVIYLIWATILTDFFSFLNIRICKISQVEQKKRGSCGTSCFFVAFLSIGLRSIPRVLSYHIPKMSPSSSVMNVRSGIRICW